MKLSRKYGERVRADVVLENGQTKRVEGTLVAIDLDRLGIEADGQIYNFNRAAAHTNVIAVYRDPYDFSNPKLLIPDYKWKLNNVTLTLEGAVFDVA